MVLSIVLLLAFSSSAWAASPLEETVDELLGTDYEWAGTTTKGFDCSGFTQYVFKQFDIELPHSSSAQASKGNPVEKKDLRAGDLVFFNTSGDGISHVGIYLGNNKFVHSATDDGVIISDMSEKYYAQRYVKARRVLGKYLYDRIAVEQPQQ